MRLFEQAVYNAQQHQHVLFAELFHTCDRLLYEFGVLSALVKELLRGQVEVIAYGKEFLHGRRGLARRYVMDVAAAVPQIVAHLVFGYALAYAQLSNPILHEPLIHDRSPLLYNDSGFSMADKQIFFVIWVDKARNICYNCGNDIFLTYLDGFWVSFGAWKSVRF